MHRGFRSGGASGVPLVVHSPHALMPPARQERPQKAPPASQLAPRPLGLPPRALDLAKVAAPTSAAFKTTTAAARAAVLARAAAPHAGVTEVVAGRRELPLFFPHHDLGLRYDGASARAAAAQSASTRAR